MCINLEYFHNYKHVILFRLKKDNILITFIIQGNYSAFRANRFFLIQFHDSILTGDEFQAISERNDKANVHFTLSEMCLVLSPKLAYWGLTHAQCDVYSEGRVERWAESAFFFK